MSKFLKIPDFSGFLMNFVQNSRFFSKFQNTDFFRIFSLNCQIPDFSKFFGNPIELMLFLRQVEYKKDIKVNNNN